MMLLAYRIMIYSVMFIAITRCIWLLIGHFRMFRVQKGASITEWGWIEILALAETVVFVVVTYILYSKIGIPEALSIVSLVGPAVGALLAVTGLIVSLWSFYVFPKVSTGHYVENEHQIITAGPYKYVRHPIYLGVILLWFSLTISFCDLAMLLITTLYVIPIYILYIRSEEKMMLKGLGEPYKEYQKCVGIIIPRFR